MVIARARGLCEYCGSPLAVSPDPFAAEHIIPQSLGGKTELDNLALSCYGCNNHKYNKIEGHDPVTDEIVPLYNPRRDIWKEHFAWDQDLTLMIGLTAIARATIEELQLNREGVVNLRRLLTLAGEHPPRESAA